MGSRGALLVVLFCLVSGCQSRQGAALTFDPANFTIASNGQSVRLRLTATDAEGNIGTGPVTLTTTAGTVEPSSAALDGFGTVLVRYSCNLAEDQACEDSATITASWSGIRATSTARLTKQVAPTARFVATGCQAVAGPRPQSSATTNAPRVGAASTVTVTPGSPFGLQVPFDDDQDDEREAIVQLNGQSTHYRCPLSAGELRDKRIELSRLSVEAGFPPGVYLLYVAVRDAAQNVSGYSVVTLSIGSGVLFKPCEAGEFQVIGALPSGPTQFYTRANGLISGYDYGAADLRLTIVYRTSVAMDLTGCQALRLRGGASGGAVGWDNCLLIEARGLNGGPLLAAWNYCSTDTAPLRDASGRPCAGQRHQRSRAIRSALQFQA